MTGKSCSAAEADRAARPERYALDVEPIVAAAFRKDAVGPDDGGDWREGLAVYLAAARDEGRLNALGVRSIAGTAIGRLQARVAIARALDAAPEIRARRIDRPIFVIGGWRTGTTLLQRLLADVPALRAAFPSELSVAWRFADLDRSARDPLHLLNPTMQAVHPSGGVR